MTKLGTALTLCLLLGSQSCVSSSPVEPIDLTQLSTAERLFLVNVVPLGSRLGQVVARFPTIKDGSFTDRDLAMSIEVPPYTVEVEFVFLNFALTAVRCRGGEGSMANLYRTMKLYCSQNYSRVETVGTLSGEIVHTYRGDDVEVKLSWGADRPLTWVFTEIARVSGRLSP